MPYDEQFVLPGPIRAEARMFPPTVVAEVRSPQPAPSSGAEGTVPGPIQRDVTAPSVLLEVRLYYATEDAPGWLGLAYVDGEPLPAVGDDFDDVWLGLGIELRERGV
jgi:hypothetical protein